MSVLLIVTLLIIAFSTVVGWRKGLLGILFSVFSWILVVVFVNVAHKPIETYLVEHTNIQQEIQMQVSEIIDKKVQETPENTGINEWYQEMTKDLPSAFVPSLQELTSGVQVNGLGEIINSGISVESLGGGNALLQIPVNGMTVKDHIVNTITTYVVSAIARGVAIVIAVVVIFILGIMVKGIGKLPVIRQINNGLGIAMGAINGFIIVWIMMYIISCIQTTAVGQLALFQIHGNWFLEFLYQNNFLGNLLSAL